MLRYVKTSPTYSMHKPLVSIAIPYHDMPFTDIFLARLLHSLSKQTFRDFEIVLTKEGKMAENSNAAIKRCKGELVKVMYMDDFFNTSGALEIMVEQFNNPKTQWLIAGATNNERPYWTEDIHTGNNKLGSPSALMFRNDEPLLFDEKMSWVLDCDLYKRLHERYGPPTIIQGPHIGIGIHDDQVSNTMSNEDKIKEHEYIRTKYK
jgi:hypothetical protein